MYTTILYEMGGIADPQLAALANLMKNEEGFLHVHVLNRLHAMEVNAHLRYHGGTSLFPHGKALTQSKQVSKSKGKVRVVTFVDDPITININNYFANLDHYFRREEGQTLSGDEIANGFASRCHHKYPLSWFDKELHQVLGINVYGRPLTGKLARIDQDNYELLVVRADLPPQEKAAAIADFIGIATEAILADISATTTVTAARLNLSDSYISEMLSSKMVRHFYKPEEIRALAEKWRHTRNSSAPSLPQ